MRYAYVYNASTFLLKKKKNSGKTKLVDNMHYNTSYSTSNGVHTYIMCILCKSQEQVVNTRKRRLKS